MNEQAPVFSCFNPRPCARGDVAWFGEFRTYHRVSIHAPARGATTLPSSMYSGKYSFNPRPCARGDPGQGRDDRVVHRFNPRPCARGDELSGHVWPLWPVSIHAPARGATMTNPGAGYQTTGFNPRPCARGDRSAGKTSRPTPGFNPRPCARGDHGGQTWEH